MHRSPLMKSRWMRAMVGTAVLLVLGAAALGAALLGRGAVLEVQVRDAVSGRWVWDLAMRIQGRETYGYYQSDAGLKTFRFTRLSPGPAVLEVAAPAYEPLRLPVRLRRGVNRLAAPIDLVGTGIPDLAMFYVFETVEPDWILSQLRPTSTQGTSILNHPCMDLWIGCRVSLQLKDGLPATKVVEEGSQRGVELFRGKIEWVWDAAPETQYRYTARIPRAAIGPAEGPYLVIDYIIVEPVPGRISPAELDELMRGILAGDPARLPEALEENRDRLRYFVDTSWNVGAGSE